MTVVDLCSNPDVLEWQLIDAMHDLERQCAGNSEFSDAMSEGERADEASSLQPDTDEQGKLFCTCMSPCHRMPVIPSSQAL